MDGGGETTVMISHYIQKDHQLQSQTHSSNGNVPTGQTPHCSTNSTKIKRRPNDEHRHCSIFATHKKVHTYNNYDLTLSNYCTMAHVIIISIHS